MDSEDGDVTHDTTKAATCTETGTLTYTATFESSAFSTQTAEVTIEATGHTLVKTEARAPTYTSTGNNAYWTCSVCHKVFKDAEGTQETTIAAETIPALVRPTPTPTPDPTPTPTPDPTPEPEEPTTPVVPDREDGKYENEDGSTTTITTETDGSKTVVNEKPVENGTEKEQQTFDKEGNYSGSIITTNTEEVKDNGDKVTTETVEIKNDTGSTTSKVTNTESVSEDGSIRTVTMTEEDGAGSVSSLTETTITVTVDIVDGKVDDSKVQDAIQQMSGSSVDDSEKTLTIVAEEVKGQVNTISVSPESMKAIADTGAQIRMGSQSMVVDLTDDVVTNLSGRNGDITLSIGYADKTQLSEQQQRKVGNATVLSVSTKVGDETIHQLGGKVTVTLPYELREGENPNSVKVYYVDDGGKLTQMVSKYDETTKTISFETTHFSYYMIGENTLPEETDDGSSGNMTLIVGVIIAVVAIAAIAAVVMTRRH